MKCLLELIATNPPWVTLRHSSVYTGVNVTLTFDNSFTKLVILSYLSTSFNILRFENTSFFTTAFPAGGTNLTIDVWIYPAASELTVGDRGNIVRATNGNAWYMSWNKDNSKLSNYWYGKTNEGYHESTAAMTRGTWNNLVSVWSSSGLSQYLNNTKTTAVTSGTAANTTNGITIGYEGDGRQFSGGIASIRMYNRALSDNEVTQNYNAQKQRYGR